MPFRFHLLGLPHTWTERGHWSACAYTAKVWKFIDMMTARGHECVHYGNQGSEVNCEHVTLLTEEERQASFGPYDRNKQAPAFLWEANRPHWLVFNARAIEEIRKRICPRDFILTLTGCCSEPVAKAFSGHMTVEYGIGYYGTFSLYRCYESHAHREWCHGAKGNKGEDYHDAVIPNYFDAREFPPPDPSPGDPYYLFVGRVNEDKGWRTAVEATKAIGAKLIIAGQGAPEGLPDHCEFIGPITVEQRGPLMAGAIASFAPTRYREPFGGVAVEAQLCGTPCITSDHGAFVETVDERWRCATLREYVAAAERAATLTLQDRNAIRARAQSRYSLEAVAPLYERYFDRIYDLWGQGWYQPEPLRLIDETRDRFGPAIPCETQIARTLATRRSHPDQASSQNEENARTSTLAADS